MKKILLIIPIAFLFFKTMHGVSTDDPSKFVEKRESERWVDYILRLDNIIASISVLKCKILKPSFSAFETTRYANQKPKIISLDKSNNKKVLKMKTLLFKYFNKDLKNYAPACRRKNFEDFGFQYGIF